MELNRSSTRQKSRFTPNRLPAVECFKNNLADLFPLVYELVEKGDKKGCPTINITILTLTGNSILSKNPDQLIRSFIDRSHKYWDKILEKNEDFFNQNLGTIFGELPAESTKAFAKLATAKDAAGQPIISPEDKKSIWEFLHSLAKISIRYIHEKRIPDVIVKNGQKQAVYRKTFKPEIPLQKHAQTWGIQLVFRKRQEFKSDFTL